MKVKTRVPVTLVSLAAQFLILSGCSKDDTCSAPELDGLTIDYGYTGDQIRIRGLGFCSSNVLSVLLNETEIELDNVSDTQVSFIMPILGVDSVSIKLVTNEGEIDLKKIALFPGNGNWMEIAAFPGSSSGISGATYSSDKGYVLGEDLFEYNLNSGSWLLIDSDEKFEEKSGTITQNTLFLAANSSRGLVETYNLESNQFGASSNFGFHYTNVPFSVAQNTYIAFADSKFIFLGKYETNSKAWITTTLIDLQQDSGVFINFGFVYQEKFYLGYSLVNLREVEFREYDPESGQLLKELPSIEIPGTFGTLLLKYLFTIDDIAYFIERSEARVNVVTRPESTLYLFNFKTESWKTVSHTYPETFFEVVSFGSGEIGFAGRSVSSGFIYSSKFYEFQPF